MELITPEMVSLSAAQAWLLLPYLILFAGVGVTLLVTVMPALSPTVSVPWISALVLLAASLASFGLMNAGAVSLFGGMMFSDYYSSLMNFFFTGVGLAVVLLSYRYLDRQRLQFAEYYTLLLLAVLGMMVMTSSLNLIVIFLGLELMSFSVYVLVGFRRADRRSNEAALKYFIMSSAASAVFLYGMALIYGATMSFHLREIVQQLHMVGGPSPLFWLGVFLLVAGFLFKVAAVPFHMWMPDVYEGAPVPITVFMTTGLKLAVFATFIRVLIHFAPPFMEGGLEGVLLQNILWICAALTMVVGNLIALLQTNLKRMLAYSSIAHTGYLLIGLWAGSSHQGLVMAGFYLLVYMLMNLGAFGVLCAVAEQGDAGMELEDFSGLSGRHPWLAFAMAVFLFSMAGLPPTAGFVAKYLLFSAGVQSGGTGLVVVAVLCSAVSVFYYLRVVVHMYMREATVSGAGAVALAGGGTVSRGVALVLALMAAIVIQAGLFPSYLLRLFGFGLH